MPIRLNNAERDLIGLKISFSELQNASKLKESKSSATDQGWMV